MGPTMSMSITSAFILGIFASTTSGLVPRVYKLSPRQGKSPSKVRYLTLELTSAAGAPPPPPPPPPYSYLGCYTEGDGVRALGAFNSVNYTTMTVETCAGLCVGTYTLFGLEYGGECWCANVFGPGAVAAPTTDCNMPCGGDVSETCGSGNRLSVYSTTPTAPAAPVHVPTAGTYMRSGCFTEGNGTRALSGAQEVDYAAMTVEKCGTFCATGSFEVMGVEYGGECYCGALSQFHSSGSTQAPDSDCSMLCAGNATEFCGAGNRMDLYLSS